MAYVKLRDKHHAEFSSLPGVFFAFTNEQFNKGMESIGLKTDDTNEVVSIGSGGYIRKNQVSALTELLKRQADEDEKLFENEDHLLAALRYELANHEYCITGDPTDALDTLGLQLDDIPEHLQKAAGIQSQQPMSEYAGARTTHSNQNTL